MYLLKFYALKASFISDSSASSGLLNFKLLKFHNPFVNEYNPNWRLRLRKLGSDLKKMIIYDNIKQD